MPSSWQGSWLGCTLFFIVDSCCTGIGVIVEDGVFSETRGEEELSSGKKPLLLRRIASAQTGNGAEAAGYICEMNGTPDTMLVYNRDAVQCWMEMMGTRQREHKAKRIGEGQKAQVTPSRGWRQGVEEEIR